MRHDFTVKFTSIELVHPPLSAQEAVWAEQANDPELDADLRSSNFYMIGARADAHFANFDLDDQEGLSFDWVVGGDVVGRGVFDPYALGSVEERSTDTVDVLLGERIIQVREHSEDEDGGDLLDWFTVDKLPWDRSRRRQGLERLSVPREVVTFDLLYVGIAVDTDSYDRLVARGHKAKAEILASEPQRASGARVADEVYLFLLRANSLYVRTLGDEWTPRSPNPVERVVSDLERAFISQLGPAYNRIRYKGYPGGKGVLSGSDLDRYGYAIAEDLTFQTSVGEFRGARDPMTGLADRGDLLIVDGTDVVVVDLTGGA